MSAPNNPQRKDHWTSTAYNTCAGFVPKLTTKVLSYLDPQPTDTILDIGCGDGSLTSQIAASGAKVLGVDASKSFIDTATEKYTSSENCTFILHDADELQTCPSAIDGNWDKAFSNAAMHWILLRENTRQTFFENVHRSLRKDGKFVFEMGGAGNCAEIQAVSIAALVHAGVSLHRAREEFPWVFPSAGWMRGMLERTGFEVEICELEYRPSVLDEGALEGWIRLMCADMLEVVEGEEKRDGVVREMCEVLETVMRRVEDGSMWMGYVMLRAVARKI
ncbi:hypothetical protein M409DRAFT_25629 [Zasmidium cellare ATCC 36951]|uniref:Methyltransferase domain-containing protein n=1 Tax=Zasmidium cellare ATCC 36951 TaxID=1080233 RepID=A0A6A6C9N4_ZASCE|nr:uncharacterized protein M409DRAFT_25629 [Zasmidium cellare ATCC 36951]KAF2163854.1 hypothetical protein M409DRAFT_25629 [Zasmidium cellare ATCC 36951]